MLLPLLEPACDLRDETLLDWRWRGGSHVCLSVFLSVSFLSFFLQSVCLSVWEDERTVLFICETWEKSFGNNSLERETWRWNRKCKSCKHDDVKFEDNCWSFIFLIFQCGFIGLLQCLWLRKIKWITANKLNWSQLWLKFVKRLKTYFHFKVYETFNIITIWFQELKTVLPDTWNCLFSSCPVMWHC